MSERNQEDCYIFSTFVWTKILKLRRNPRTNHILHPANRYDDTRCLIWPRREKKVNCEKTQEALTVHFFRE